jgi:BCD family chlorophyll transporter-like MFS transporter
MSMLKRISIRYLPFADAASDELPLGQLLRLSLFQVSVGMAAVMLLGTLNRVMIVELQVPAFLVAAMVALPVLIAPSARFWASSSDTYKSAIGWKRIPTSGSARSGSSAGLPSCPPRFWCWAGNTQVRYDIPYAGEVLAALAFLMTGPRHAHDPDGGPRAGRRPRDG